MWQTKLMELVLDHIMLDARCTPYAKEEKYHGVASYKLLQRKAFLTSISEEDVTAWQQQQLTDYEHSSP